MITASNLNIKMDSFICNIYCFFLTELHKDNKETNNITIFYTEIYLRKKIGQGLDQTISMRLNSFRELDPPRILEIPRVTRS